MPKMTATQLKKMCLLTTYGCQLDLMRSDGFTMSTQEAREVLEAALACLPETREGVPVVGEDFLFCFPHDDKGFFDPEDMKVPVWNVLLFHKENGTGYYDDGSLTDYISESDLDDLGIGGSGMECCYEVEGETRRDIKDRLEKAGFTYQPWGLGEEPGEGWRSYPDLDRLTVPEEPWEFL